MKKILIFMLFIMIIPLSACEKGKEKITIAEVAHSVFYAPQYVALNLGFFEEEGLEVNLINANGADKVMAALLSKDVQIGLAGAEASIYVYNEGQENYAINFAQLTQKDGNFLIGREKIENFDFSMLAGKEVLGGRRGGMPEMVLEYALKQNDLLVGRDDASVMTNGGVNVRTDVQFAALAGAFTSGEGDYVTLFEPTGTLLENSNGGFVLASLGEETGIIPYTNYFCTKNYLSDNTEIIQKFTNAIYKGQQWVYSHTPKEIAEQCLPFFKDSTLEELTKVMERYQSIEAWAKTPVLDEKAYDLFLNIMEEAGELEKRAPYDKIVVIDYAKNAIKNS